MPLRKVIDLIGPGGTRFPWSDAVNGALTRCSSCCRRCSSRFSASVCSLESLELRLAVDWQEVRSPIAKIAKAPEVSCLNGGLNFRCMTAITASPVWRFSGSQPVFRSSTQRHPGLPTHCADGVHGWLALSLQDVGQRSAIGSRPHASP